jgi:hypothetical protein
MTPKVSRDDGKWKAEQEQRRKEEAIANTTGIRVLSAIGAAVPVRLPKRDLQFLLNQIAPLLDEWRLQTLARQHGIRKDRETDAIGKLLAAFVRGSDEGTLSRLLVESIVLLAAARTNPSVVLRESAATYKVDTDAIALKVKQEFAAKEKAKKSGKPTPPTTAKTKKAAYSFILNSVGRPTNSLPTFSVFRDFAEAESKLSGDGQCDRRDQPFEQYRCCECSSELGSDEPGCIGWPDSCKGVCHRSGNRNGWVGEGRRCGKPIGGSDISAHGEGNGGGPVFGASPDDSE